jgi:NtrC-family two-component system response regulator AlgB
MNASPAPNPAQPLHVLVVDDELNIRKALAACLEVDGHRVTAVATEADAVMAVAQRSFDLAFVDMLLQKTSGLDLIPKILAVAPWTKIVVITAFASIDSAVKSMKRGAADYLPKPFTPAQVAIVTGKVAQIRALEQRVSDLQDELGQVHPEVDLRTASPAMQTALNTARQVAQSDATVLIQGESGTGKSILARAIHAWSPRAHKPFAVISCPTLSAELLESELFGHIRGAFTGAVRDNPGRIAASEGGTLFLDEVGELPLRMQPKLLRFLQERRYERVGDQTTRTADVRMIAATNVDLRAAVARGEFREDLWYRLNVVALEPPPLRQRTEDIGSLAETLLAYLGKQNRKPALRLSPRALSALREYPWPGNVRELRNAVERAAILCTTDTVEAEHLFNQRLPSDPNLPQIGDPIPMEKVEELHIRRVLAATPSIDKASAILGMDTVTLWRRRKKYGI